MKRWWYCLHRYTEEMCNTAAIHRLFLPKGAKTQVCCQMMVMVMTIW